MKLIDLLPNFTVELQQACERLGRSDLIAQLATVELANNTHNVNTQVAQLRLRHQSDVEPSDQSATTDTGPANERVILRHRYGVRAETDHEGRLRRLVLAHGTEITEALGRFSSLRQ